ncbi:hypothetical protein PQX77_004357 [Marasmius sp. AFHP31]|nr:hypothetical protein PQX77_004357 [Marasmius sp. AFHP31]
MSSGSPDPLDLYIKGITPSLNLLIIGSVWSAALVPLFILLLFWSTPSLRRQPIFYMNVLAVVLGIVLGIMNLKLYVGQILNPRAAFPIKTLLAYIGMIILLPIFMDCILAFRLFAVYPPRTISTRLFAIIFVPIVLFKVARFTNILVFLVKFSNGLTQNNNGSAIANFQRLWDTNPSTKIEWIFQVVDNCYTSGWFLWRLWGGYVMERSSGVVSTTGGMSRKIQTLFFWALSSFLFPTIFSIVQVAIVFNNHNFFLGAYIFVTNIYLEIICVMLATIWTVSVNRSNESSAGGSTLKDISFRAASRETHVASGTTASVDHELHDIRLAHGVGTGSYSADGKSNHGQYRYDS